MGGKSALLSRYWLLIICLIFASSTLMISGPVLAQDDAEEFTLEEIVVTGSRIAKNNNESTSPIVTVDEDLFDAASTSAIETQLNKLPQFTPTIDVPQVAGQDIQPTATNTPGEATVALRGIGANRTLVLINGRRGTPSNANGVLDINTIPTAAIQYVEAISGGASSTYGADAMAGVLNFIMKDRFEGMEVDALGSITQYGDNEELTVSGVMGTNFADDRGNIMMAFAYNDRKGAKQNERSWFKKNWRDPSIGGTMFFPPFSGYNAWYGNYPDPDVLNDVMDLPEGQGFGEGDNAYNPAGMLIWATQDGQVFTGFDAAGIPGIPAAEDAGIVDGYEVKLQNNGYLGQNNVDTYLIFPLERYNFYTQGDYKINDYVGVFTQAYFSRTRAKTIQEPGIITSGWSIPIDPSINRNSIPAEMLAVLDSRTRPAQPGEEGYITPTEANPFPVQPTVSGGDDEFRLQALLPQNREGNTDTLTFNVTAGLEGEFPSIDWTWEAFASHGEAETTSLMTGFYSLERMRMVMQSEEFGKGMSWTANEGPPDYNFGAATGTCTSGLNPWDWDNVTQDCWDAVEGSVKSKQLMEQTIWEGNAQGHIADLPTGELRGAVGVSFRENNYYFLSDNLNTQGRSINDQVLGLYPAGESSGTIKATEGYAELLVPVMKEMPFAEKVELNLGGRRSDYNTTGVSYTYKAELNWKTNQYLRFRGGYNRAERAPNVAELYLARTSSFGVMSYGDACSMDNNILSYSADPVLNEDTARDTVPNPDWYDAVALCGQLMENNGVDTADDEYYGFDWRTIYDYAEANGGAVYPDMYEANPDSYLGENYIETQPDGGFSFIWPIDVGNPNLKPEIADTWTAGFVLDSFVEEIPALMDWRISLDYYIIEIKDAIGLQTGDVVIQQCMDPVFNPTGDPNSPYCEGFNRNIESGALSTLERSYFNNGHFKTSGIDFQVNWGMQAGPGRVSVSSLINYLLKMDSTELDGVNPMIDYVGTYGPSGNGLNGNSFEWRSLTTVTYALDPVPIDLSIRWQHLDGLHSVTPTDATPLPSYDMFDLLGNYQIMDNVRVRFGVENLFNKAPELYGRDYTATNGMYGGSFSTQLHDVVGRRFYVGTKVYF